ncbi:MAG TPA: hypothetical protein VNA69_24245 [Thermoanaerobaculia bacterium]|nr:hypothetical protein [Thermoanaerobaculia bacterium]
MTYDDDKAPIAIPLDQLKQLAMTVAQELSAAAAAMPDAPIAGTGGGSLHRKLPDELRDGFIDVRAALFQRGIIDPVLVRFDTATVSQASTQELATRLAAVAESL